MFYLFIFFLFYFLAFLLFFNIFIFFFFISPPHIVDLRYPTNEGAPTEQQQFLPTHHSRMTLQRKPHMSTTNSHI